MNTIKVLSEDAVIKGIDFSASYYLGLSNLLAYLAEPERLVELKGTDQKRYEELISPYLILFSTLDQKAEEQGLTRLATAEELGLINPSL